MAALGSCLGAFMLAGPVAAAAPSRVVSINLCTDQLAMLLAAPGQLVSVSMLATEPQSSAMVEEARAYPPNYGQAEQVFLLRPDLVLAGTYTAQGTVALLRRLGVTVVEVPPANALADVAQQVRMVGESMGRDAEAEALVAEFEAGLADLRLDGATPIPAAIYYPNGYTTGSGTLADEILRISGFGNVGAAAGVTGGGVLPLELLVMAAPQMIVTSSPYPGASRAEEVLVHPALASLRDRAGEARVSDADWVCGTPFVLRAVAQMAAARRALGPVE